LPDGLAGRPLLEALRKTLIGRNGTVPTADGPRPFINLDNAASTPTFEPVWRAALAGWRMPPAAATTLAGEAEAIVARMLGAPPEAYDVFFTANTTEAINLASESLGREVRQGTEPVIVDTLLEHNSNELPWRMVPAASLVRTPIDGEGFFDLDALEATLRAHNVEGRHGKKRVVLVAVSGASNVLGTFNDLSAVAEIAHRYGARLLVDGAQLVAHRRVALEAWGVDYLALSAHKVYAPFGSGALVVRRGLLAFGPDEMAEIRASGVENTGGIAALSAALSLLERIGLDVVRKEEQALTAQALRGMARIPNLRIYGVADPDSPNFAAKGGVIAFDPRGVLPGRVAAALAWQGGIGVRYGCHCAHLLIKRLVGVNPPLEQLQGLLLRMNHSLALPGVVRVSFGIENTEADVAALLRALGDLARRPPARKDGAMRDALEQFAQGAAERVYG
jgi:selenocysteine lyase/cysteine desulfurase